MDCYTKIKKLIEEKEVSDKVRYLESNRRTVKTYFEIGKLLFEAQGKDNRAKYGDNLIKKWSEKFVVDYGKNYSYRNLNYMRKFYQYFRNVNTLCSQFNLSWPHYRTLLKFDNENERNYYINLCTQNNLSVRELNSFVAVELKLNSVIHKDIGQILFYMKLIDNTLKENYHNKTIGIIVSKNKDKFILEYVSDEKIFLTTYKITS